METFYTILDGLMLGDGSIFKERPTGNARYCHDDHHILYVKYLMDLARKIGCTFAPNSPYPHYNKKYKSLTWAAQTHVDPFFTKEYFRWYSGGTKIIPTDLILTPDILRHLYIGDGCLGYDRERVTHINFATHCFSTESKEIFREKMEQLNFPLNFCKNGSMNLKKSCVEYFLSYIGKCPISCYQYKWSIENRDTYNILKNGICCQETISSEVSKHEERRARETFDGHPLIGVDPKPD